MYSSVLRYVPNIPCLAFWINVRHVPGNQRPKPKSIGNSCTRRPLRLQSSPVGHDVTPDFESGGFYGRKLRRLFMHGMQNEDDDNYDNYT